MRLLCMSKFCAYLCHHKQRKRRVSSVAQRLYPSYFSPKCSVLLLHLLFAQPHNSSSNNSALPQKEPCTPTYLVKPRLATVQAVRSIIGAQRKHLAVDCWSAKTQEMVRGTSEGRSGREAAESAGTRQGVQHR